MGKGKKKQAKNVRRTCASPAAQCPLEHRLPGHISGSGKSVTYRRRPICSLQKKEVEPEIDTVQQMPSVAATVSQEITAIDDVQADSLVVVEVFEVRNHHKLSADQALVTVFDGEDMYQVGDRMSDEAIAMKF